jgi:hypothetical protein
MDPTPNNPPSKVPCTACAYLDPNIHNTMKPRGGGYTIKKKHE